MTGPSFERGPAVAEAAPAVAEPGYHASLWDRLVDNKNKIGAVAGSAIALAGGMGLAVKVTEAQAAACTQDKNVIYCTNNQIISEDNIDVDLQMKAGESIKLNVQMRDSKGRLIVHPNKSNWQDLNSPAKSGCVVEVSGDAKNHDSRTQPGAPFVNHWKDNRGNWVPVNDHVKSGDAFRICANGVATKIRGHRKDGTPYDCENLATFAHIPVKPQKIVVVWTPGVNASWSANAKINKHIHGTAEADCHTLDNLSQAHAELIVDQVISIGGNFSGNVKGKNFKQLKSLAQAAAKAKAMGVDIKGAVSAYINEHITGKVDANCFENLAPGATTTVTTKETTTVTTTAPTTTTQPKGPNTPTDSTATGTNPTPTTPGQTTIECPPGYSVDPATGRCH